MNQRLSVRWLQVACVATMLVGLMAAAASTPALDGPWRLLFDLLRWPIDGDPDGFGDDARALNAVLGGVMFGWGLLMFDLTRRFEGPELRRITVPILLALGAWFVIDSTGSILAGIPGNVVLNVLFAAFFVPPLALLSAKP